MFKFPLIIINFVMRHDHCVLIIIGNQKNSIDILISANYMKLL